MDPERRRLEEVPKGRSPWRRWGPYLSERAWGTVREDYSAERRRVGVLSARSRPLARLPLERGRTRRDLRRPPDALLRAGGLERPRPDPQGAHLRAHRERGQPRRGRQGVLVLPRLDADPLLDALALHVPAGGVSVCPPDRREPRAGQARARVRAGRYRRSSTTAATGRSPPTTRRPSPEELLVRIAVRNAGPDTATLDLLPTLWFRNTWSWGLRRLQAVDRARR